MMTHYQYLGNGTYLVTEDSRATTREDFGLFKGLGSVMAVYVLTAIVYMIVRSL